MTAGKNAGFSLMELLIAIAIVGIIAAIAIPTYTTQRLKGNRSEGYAALNEIMQAQERWAVDNGTYTTDISNLGYSNPQVTENGWYSIAAGTCASGTIANCVLLTATAQGGQVNDANGNGGDLTLNSRGTKVGW